MYVVMKSFYYPKLWQTVFKVIMKHAAMRDTVHGHMPLRGFVGLLREIDIIIMHMLVKRLHVLLYNVYALIMGMFRKRALKQG